MSGTLTDRFGRPLFGSQRPVVEMPNAPRLDLVVGSNDQHVVVAIMVGGQVTGAVPLTVDQAAHHIEGVQKAIDDLKASQCPTEFPPTSQDVLYCRPDIRSTISTSEIESHDSSTCPPHGDDAGQPSS